MAVGQVLDQVQQQRQGDSTQASTRSGQQHDDKQAGSRPEPPGLVRHRGGVGAFPSPVTVSAMLGQELLT